MVPSLFTDVITGQGEIMSSLVYMSSYLDDNIMVMITVMMMAAVAAVMRMRMRMRIMLLLTMMMMRRS